MDSQQLENNIFEFTISALVSQSPFRRNGALFLAISLDEVIEDGLKVYDEETRFWGRILT